MQCERLGTQPHLRVEARLDSCDPLVHASDALSSGAGSGGSSGRATIRLHKRRRDGSSSHLCGRLGGGAAAGGSSSGAVCVFAGRRCICRCCHHDVAKWSCRRENLDCHLLDDDCGWDRGRLQG